MAKSTPDVDREGLQTTMRAFDGRVNACLAVLVLVLHPHDAKLSKSAIDLACRSGLDGPPTSRTIYNPSDSATILVFLSRRIPGMDLERPLYTSGFRGESLAYQAPRYVLRSALAIPASPCKSAAQS